MDTTYSLIAQSRSSLEEKGSLEESRFPVLENPLMLKGPALMKLELVAVEAPGPVNEFEELMEDSRVDQLTGGRLASVLHRKCSSVYIRQIEQRTRLERAAGSRKAYDWPYEFRPLNMDDKEVLETEAIYREKEKTHPDGGYGWVVVFCGFSIQFVAVGLQNSSGTIFPALIEEYNRSKGDTGERIVDCWVISCRDAPPSVSTPQIPQI
eukprot:gene16929-8417_t